MSGGPSAELTRNHGYWDILATFLANCCKEKCQAQVLLFFFVGVDKKMAELALMSPTKKKPEDRTRCFG